jgi:hypothetical protein
MGVSRFKLPPPNNLISARCSSLDSASQPDVSDIAGPWGISALSPIRETAALAFEASQQSRKVGTGGKRQRIVRMERSRSGRL